MELDLKDLLQNETIRAKVSVSSWEEATDCVGELLVKAGAVQWRYVEAMKRVFREMGPYAVISPGVALLHARPEDGVIRPCLGLITLKTPVKFGHTENDPVDLVFALGATDKSSHLLALQNLAQLLSDQEKVSRLRTATSDEELLQAILEDTPNLNK